MIPVSHREMHDGLASTARLYFTKFPLLFHICKVLDVACTTDAFMHLAVIHLQVAQLDWRK